MNLNPLSHLTMTTTDDLNEILGISDDEGIGEDPFDTLPEEPTITYDLKDTLAHLRPLVAGAHDKNKAKYVLTLIALTRLVEKYPNTRKELLSAYSDFPKPGKQIEPATKQVDWFKALLDRMITQGLVERTMEGSTMLYQGVPSQQQRMESILLDAMHNNGQEVKHLLWPNEYPLQEPASAPEREAVTETEPEKEQEGVNLIQELTSQLMTTLSPLAQHLGGIYEKLEALETKMADHVTSMEKIGPSIDQKFAAFAKQLEVRTILQGISERVAEQQSRRKSLINQLAADSVREEKVLADLAAIMGGSLT